MIPAARNATRIALTFAVTLASWFASVASVYAAGMSTIVPDGVPPEL